MTLKKKKKKLNKNLKFKLIRFYKSLMLEEHKKKKISKILNKN